MPSCRKSVHTIPFKGGNRSFMAKLLWINKIPRKRIESFILTFDSAVIYDFNIRDQNWN
jgi:hypothetical protein